MSLKWWRGPREEPSAATAGPASPAGPSGSGATAPEPADAQDTQDTQQDGTGTHDTHSAEVMTAEQGVGFAELPTEAPRTGPLSPLPAPLLTGLPTGLPGMRADGGLLRGRWIAAASLTGTSHLLHGTSGQDVYRYTATHDGSGLVLVVCDGLGSRPATAQTGAGLLASYLCEAAAHITGQRMAEVPQDVLREVLATGNAAVRRHRAAVLEPLTDSDLAATVAVCWLPLPAEGEGEDEGVARHALTGHAVRVGDCNVFTLARGRYEAPFPAASEGPANVVTAYLPCEDPARVAEYSPVALAGVDAVVVTTDGLAIDLFDSPSVRTWLASRWSVPCGPARMLDSLRYRRQGSHDDRTALITWSAPLDHIPRLEP
ncbi:protein phosphatase 2C domain-containing protein [Streptomyces sp. KCTC 0041BP]|uniref:protein phosphatase 2C domain-containing protein n=1 Tax=Streptomyces sp. KCTC 0041BP TaxID=201500 RepID=UPI001AE5CF80|nr:protein phosphatase 2C domain-containing protein [Streptomyces sp. KCTC 0041BP]MBP0937932.1 protein phosphatase 2C domain-containing protein [Streptomyces sp. KCTC 0041BP]